MTLSALELANCYAAAWGEKHPRKRLELLRTCCEEDVRFLQEGIDEVTGVQALSDLIGDFWSGIPDALGLTAEITSDIQEHHGFGRGSFVWKYPGNENYPAMSFAERGPSGKMKTIVVFGDPSE